MKRAAIVLAGLTAGLVGLSASPAAAWDCIRVSGSAQGLQQSTKSGNWEYLTLDDLMAGAGEAGVPEDVATCVADHWREDGRQEFFAVGTGVGGARGAMTSGHITDEDFFVLAMNAPVKVTSDGHGVDHLESVLGMYLEHCGFSMPDDAHH
ncbi:MAG TPA: hypothetical protein VFO98_09310 [Marmoricola sp.]|jgi:hypothetical protein|nr:hypothetical protein [Marmoricola sp.]